MSVIEEELAEIATCSAALRVKAEKHGRLGIYKADCFKIADTTDALVAEVRLLRTYVLLADDGLSVLLRSDRKLGHL